jgi:DNA-binding CsgD family transcriptional regulator
MPRHSPYTITLTAKEREELEALARRYTSPYRDVVRAKIVLYAAAGLRNDEIGARLDTPRQIVSKWRKRFAHERLPGLVEQSRADRKRAAASRTRASPESQRGCQAPSAARKPTRRAQKLSGKAGKAR